MSIRTHRRGGAIRLLTLICFFHFTGINNGLTYAFVSSGRIERTDPAVACLMQWTAAVNPALWRTFVLKGGWRSLCSQPRIVLHSASRQTLRQLISETTLLGRWAKGTCARTVQTSGTEKAGADRNAATSCTAALRTAVPHAFLTASQSAVLLKERWTGVKRLGVWENENYGAKDFSRGFGRLTAVRDSILPPPPTALETQAKEFLEWKESLSLESMGRHSPRSPGRGYLAGDRPAEMKVKNSSSWNQPRQGLILFFPSLLIRTRRPVQ